MSASAITYQTPLTLGDLSLKNRVIYAPCTRNRNNTPDESQAKYYAQRASAGLIISEGTLPIPQGYEFANAPGIYSKKQIAGWKKVTDAVHAQGGLIVQQIMHIGRVAHPLLQSGQKNIGPSAIKAKGGKFRMLTNFEYYDYTHKNTVYIKEPPAEYVTPDPIEDPWEVIADYKQAITNSKTAGFDGVELHFANGYLGHQFLDTSANQRSDEWGGSAEKRCKFAFEVVEAASSIFGAGRVGIKLSPSGGFNDMGMPEDETIATYSHLLKGLSEKKIAYVHVQRWFATFDPVKRGTPLDPEVLRKYYTGNWLLNGEISRSEGADLLSSNKAHGIVFGRDFIANPDLPRRIFDKLPLQTWDWSTFYTAGNGEVGYSDYKTWDQLTEDEKEKLGAAGKY